MLSPVIADCSWTKSRQTTVTSLYPLDGTVRGPFSAFPLETLVRQSFLLDRHRFGRAVLDRLLHRCDSFLRSLDQIDNPKPPLPTGQHRSLEERVVKSEPLECLASPSFASLPTGL